MVLNKVIIAIFCVTFFSVNAQKFELGKVSIEELQQKTHPIDTSAVAAVLFEKGKVNFNYSQDNGFEVTTEVKIRIKIYKKGGYDWANKSIRFYNETNQSKEVATFSDAITYNLVDGKIVKTKLKSDGEFEEKINKYWGRKKISMPNVKEGSIIEYSYSVKSPNYGELASWNFQTSIPVNYSEFITYIPEYFMYNTNQKGYYFPKRTVERNRKSITLTSKERSESRVTTTTFSNDVISYEEVKSIYVAENVPAIKEEAYVNNIDNYTSGISHELTMTKFPNTTVKMYSTDWETVVKTIYDNENFGPELNKTGYFEEDIKTLMAGLTTKEEKLLAIFNFVKSKVKWNDYFGYSCNDGVKTAYKNKTGNAAEINLMLTAMLRYAGLSANPVLLSTRSNGIALFPNRTAFNYVIAAVEVENDLVLLDATEKFSAPNILPSRDLNWFGRIIRKDGSSAEVELSPKMVSKDITNMSYTINADGSINGKLRRQMSDHVALSFRQVYVGLSTDNYLEKLESRNNNVELSEYKRDNETDLSKQVLEFYAFKDTKSTEIIGNKVYISPLLFLSSSENPFKQEKREYPVDFGFPFEDKYNVIIDIPEGYAVESIPTEINLATGDGIGTFKYFTSNTANKIQIQLTTDINAAIVPAEYYDILKEFFKKMIEKQNEKIILTKKS
jgi:transglutaminase-like putative cysteine protease